MMTYIVIGICIAFLCDLLLNNVNLKAIKNINMELILYLCAIGFIACIALYLMK